MVSPATGSTPTYRAPSWYPMGTCFPQAPTGLVNNSAEEPLCRGIFQAKKSWVAFPKLKVQIIREEKKKQNIPGQPWEENPEWLKEQNHRMNIWVINSWGKSENTDIKELLGQHAEHSKNHYIFPNRNLMLHPHRVNGRTRYRLLFLERGNRAGKQNTAAVISQPWITSVNQRTARLSTGGTKEKVAFGQQLVPQLFPLCADFLQDCRPILRDFVF